ncbi:MAG TPA: hypothetical protein VFA39_22110 [Steroidobacteraceae bacterium]|nr:hypothetical protein [Steroidobacteraceae bacterium]
MTIGTSEDGEIATLFPVDEQLFIVKERAIYAITLADQIDPERATASIPDSQQRVLGIGASDPIVSRLLLTGHVLFRRDRLGQDFNERRAIKLSWELTKRVAAMDALQKELEAAQTDAANAFRAEQHSGRSLRLPTVANLEAQFHAFAQKLGHAVDALKGVSRLFYPDLPKKWIDRLRALTVDKFGAQHPFAAFINDMAPALLDWRELRNVIEHEDRSRSARIVDFHMLPDGSIGVPVLEVQRGEGKPERIQVVPFMSETIHNLTVIAEAFMAHLCNANVMQDLAWPIQVMSVPDEEQGRAKVRLCYVIQMPDGRHSRLG